MKSVNVSLNSIDKVKSFVNEMCRIEGDVFLHTGR